MLVLEHQLVNIFGKNCFPVFKQTSDPLVSRQPLYLEMFSVGLPVLPMQIADEHIAKGQCMKAGFSAALSWPMPDLF